MKSWLYYHKTLPDTYEFLNSALANVVRQHYKLYPHAIALQASGETISPTVNNHR